MSSFIIYAHISFGSEVMYIPGFFSNVCISFHSRLMYTLVFVHDPCKYPPFVHTYVHNSSTYHTLFKIHVHIHSLLMYVSHFIFMCIHQLSSFRIHVHTSAVFIQYSYTHISCLHSEYKYICL